MEPPELEVHSAEERDPEPHRTEAKRGENHNSRTPTPTQDRKKGEANDKQSTRTTVTDPQSRTIKQGVSNRVKSTKLRDPHSTSLLLQTEVHKGTTRPKQTTIQPHLSDGSTYRPDDTLTNGTAGPSSEKEGKKPTIPTKETPNSQAVTELNLLHDQTECTAVTGIEPPPTHLVNPESDRELLLGYTSQGQDGPSLGPQPDIMDTGEPTLPAPSVPGRRRKGQPVAKGSTQDRAMSTLLTENAKTALPEPQTHMPTETKDDGPAPTLMMMIAFIITLGEIM